MAFCKFVELFNCLHNPFYPAFPIPGTTLELSFIQSFLFGAVTPFLLSLSATAAALPLHAFLLGTLHSNGVVAWDLSCHPFSVSISLPVPPCLAN